MFSSHLLLLIPCNLFCKNLHKRTHILGFKADFFVFYIRCFLQNQLVNVLKVLKLFLKVKFCIDFIVPTDEINVWAQLFYYSVTNSTRATQGFSANHKKNKNQSLFRVSSFRTNHKWGSNLTGNWCERHRESGLQCFCLWQNVVNFHHRKSPKIVNKKTKKINQLKTKNVELECLRWT